MAKRKIIRATDIDVPEGLVSVLQGIEDRLSSLESKPPIIKTIEVVEPAKEKSTKKGKSK